MKNTLLINASVNGEGAFSTKLAAAIVEKLSAQNPDGEVRSIDLAAAPYPQLTGDYVATYWKPAADRTNEENILMASSDSATRDLLWADNLVIGAPLINFSIPSLMKSWIEHIVRPGVTFRYTDEGHPEGLVMGKKVYLAISSGGIYSEGPTAALDHSEPYLRTIFGFLGMTDITTFRVEGVNIPSLQDTALSNAIASIEIDGAWEQAARHHTGPAELAEATA